jgi:hypothetical protein
MVAKCIPPTGTVDVPSALAKAQLVLSRLQNAVPGPIPAIPAPDVYYVQDFLPPDGLDYMISKAAQWIDKISQLPSTLTDPTDQQLDQTACQIEADVTTSNLNKRIDPTSRTYTTFTTDVEGTGGVLSDLGVILNGSFV